MKKTKIITMCLLAMMLVFVLSSCSDKGKFVGKWLSEDSIGDTLVLANDGTGTFEEDGFSGSVKWKLDNKKVSITFSICGMTELNEYSYKFSKDTMILTDEDGDVHTFIKDKSK